jgi:membrane protein
VYGSIGAVFILMSLIYLNSLALLMGFELNVVLSHLRMQKRESVTASASGNNHP